MCENPDIISKAGLQRLEQRLLAESQRGDNELKVDDSYAYLRGKAVPKETWRREALRLGLPPDMYLDIATLAGDESGVHHVKHGSLAFAVDVNWVIESKYGQHRLVRSVAPYES